jgi:hypothetical protein
MKLQVFYQRTALLSQPKLRDGLLRKQKLAKKLLKKEYQEKWQNNLLINLILYISRIIVPDLSPKG